MKGDIMKKIIPFRKEIKFDTNLYEVTSISLENTLHKNNNEITGSFIVAGEYRVTETSVNTLPFNYDLPFTIDIDETYDISDATIDINDFYYEIIDNKVLVVNIEVKLDNIKEIILEREEIVDIEREEPKEKFTVDVNDNNVEVNNINLENVDLGDVTINTVTTEQEIPKSLFANLDSSDNYVNYRVYIMRENDNLDNIMTKYNVTKDMLDKYNDLNNIKIGDKIIIPYVKG